MSGRDIVDLGARGGRAVSDPSERKGQLERHVDQLERDLGQAAVAHEALRRAEEQAEKQLAATRRELDLRRAQLEQRLERARALVDEFSALKAQAVELDSARRAVDADLDRVRWELEREAERYRALRRECHDSALALTRIRASLRRVEQEVNVLLAKQEISNGTP